MCRKSINRSIVLILAFLPATSLPGCGGGSTGDPPAVASAASGDTTQASPTAAKIAGAPAGNPEALVNAESFETIAFASDTSYQSPPIPSGTLAGEVRELTALKIQFRWCPAGTFRMGSSDDAPNHQQNEKQFDVTISKGFWLQQTEVTQTQYAALMGINPSYFKGESNPVETVNWTEVTEFCRRLCDLPPEKNSGNRYRLPTEAEWEYGCRAGSASEFCYGDDEEQLEEYAWYHKNAARTTHPVGGKLPNAWGLQDMHGNVLEWCSDYFSDYPTGSVTDPAGRDSGDMRCVRGGGWFFVPLYARSPHRDAYIATARYVGLGFRLVAEPSPLQTPE